MSTLVPAVSPTDEGCEVLTESHRIAFRESTPEHVWIEPLDESGEYVMVPLAGLVATSAALLALHVKATTLGRKS